MTKREPLAVVETGGPEYQLFNPVRIVVGGQPLSPTTDIEEAYRDAELINDALDKAVREAVEEFKNRVVGVVIKNVTQSIDDRRVPAKVGHDIYEKILALPTEREGQ